MDGVGSNSAKPMDILIRLIKLGDRVERLWLEELAKESPMERRERKRDSKIRFLKSDPQIRPRLGSDSHAVGDFRVSPSHPAPVTLSPPSIYSVRRRRRRETHCFIAGAKRGETGGPSGSKSNGTNA